MEIKCIRILKKGEFFKRVIKGQPSERVYVKGDYDRSSKSFSCFAFDDINQEIFIKADKSVFVCFTF